MVCMENTFAETSKQEEKAPTYGELLSMYRKAKEEICQKDRLMKELQAELEQKKRIIIRANTERFLDREDGRAYPGRSRSEVRKEGRLHLSGDGKGKGGRKAGTRNYSQMDLGELSKGNDVISNDCLEEMKASHPDWDFVRFDERTSYVVTRVRAHIVAHKAITPGYLATRPDRTAAAVSVPSLSVINHSFAGAGLLSDLVTVKYVFGVPPHRYCLWLQREGIHVDLRTVYGWLESVSDLCRPVYDEIKGELGSLGFPVYHIDETYFKIVDFVKEGSENSYMFMLSGEKPGKKVKLYMFSKDRRTDLLLPVLKGYRGKLTVDGYAGYDRFAGDIGIQYCLEHLKRRFADIAKTLTDSRKETSASFRAVKLIDRILANEKAIAEKGLTPGETVCERATEGYLSDIRACQDFLSGIDAAEESDLAAAIGYYRNKSRGFFTFLTEGNLAATNNEAEDCAKSFDCVRKDSLFAKSEKGGEERRHADDAGDDGHGKRGLSGPLHREAPEEHQH